MTQVVSESNQQTADPNGTEAMPRWIYWFGFLLAVIGMTAGILGILAPTMFFNDFESFTQWPEISYVTTGWGIRNLGMGVAMLFALRLRLPSAIAAVFSMRFVTELGDLLNTLATGHGSQGMPLFIVAMVWILIFLVPEALAARWGIARSMPVARQPKTGI